MPALKTSAARILAGLAASALFAPAICAAAQVKVNDEAPLDLQSPPGFTYTTGGTNATLSVATSGYLACANIVDEGGGSMLTNITMVPQHGQWRFPAAVDLRSVGYGSGTLAIGRNAQGTISSALTCHASGAEGEILEPLSDGLMQSGFDSKMVEQFSSLVNWIPSQGFSWSNPVWSQVPTDPCSPTIDQPARTTEEVSCGAAVGAKPNASTTERSPTLWTATDGVNFYYVARIDARWGAPAGGIPDSGSALPSTTRQPYSPLQAEYKLVESYSRGVLGVGGGYLGDAGQWCVLAALPSALDASVCNGAPLSGALNGPFVSAYADGNFGIMVGGVGTSRLSFYMAFVRPIVGSPPPVDEPAVEVSMLIDPVVGSAGGDRFKGDDVVFGFLPTSQGFPWMHGGQ